MRLATKRIWLTLWVICAAALAADTGSARADASTPPAGVPVTLPVGAIASDGEIDHLDVDPRGRR